MNENMKSEITYFVKKLDQFDDETLNAIDLGMVESLKSFLGANPKLAILEKLLKDYTDARNAIIRTDLPNALATAGLASATVEGGLSVSLETYFETKQVDKEKVASWLEEHDYADIIKDTVILPKGAYTHELENFMIENHIDFKRDSTINGASLKSVVRKHIEAGGEPPSAEAMEVRTFVQAKIKREKVTL